MASEADQSAVAASEGRRIYLGNLLYAVKPHEVDTMLKDQGFDQVEKIHISVDPVTGRNPGYCFVDFHNREDAENALTSIQASIRERPVRVGPYEAKKERPDRRWKSAQEPTFRRWGSWTGQRGLVPTDDVDSGVPIGDVDRKGIEHGPYGAMDHFDEMSTNRGGGRRLYVGGLGKMIDQQHNNDEISQIFVSAGFQPTVISKRITPHETARARPGNHHYCFVDFATVEEAEAAALATDGVEVPQYGGRLRVNIAGGMPRKLTSRAPNAGGGWAREPAARRDNNSWQGASERRQNEPRGDRGQRGEGQAPRALVSDNWRRKDDAA